MGPGVAGLLAQVLGHAPDMGAQPRNRLGQHASRQFRDHGGMFGARGARGIMAPSSVG